MKLTKTKLKQIIKEEMDYVIQEQKDPNRLEAAATAMALLVNGVTTSLSEIQGGGRPPEIMIEGTAIFDWFANKSGYSKEEIAAVARKKKVTIQ
jgi:hypothetical protein